MGHQFIRKTKNTLRRLQLFALSCLLRLGWCSTYHYPIALSLFGNSAFISVINGFMLHGVSLVLHRHMMFTDT